MGRARYSNIAITELSPGIGHGATIGDGKPLLMASILAESGKLAPRKTTLARTSLLFMTWFSATG
jgi:hypothetical protein